MTIDDQVAERNNIVVPVPFNSCNGETTDSSSSTRLPPQSPARTVRLLAKDWRDREVWFRLGASTPLRKLMDRYCRRFGVELALIQFMILGERLKPNDTVAGVPLEDDDLIAVVVAH